MTEVPGNKALIGFGQVRHTRLRPVRNAFAYPTYFLMLPMRALQQDSKLEAGALAINRPGLISFHDTDHGDGRGQAHGGALRWLDEVLQAEGIADATGEVWLHCYPRVLGYAFKPVSFWHCHRAAHDQGGALRAIVVEVNNTFGERHCYLLDQPRMGLPMAATKVFHVSPFCETKGQYQFRFMRVQKSTHEYLLARIDYHDDLDPCEALLQTSISGTLHPATRANLRRAFWRYPAMTFGVVFHIHWQAVRLWLKGVKISSKPAVPKAFVTR